MASAILCQNDRKILQATVKDKDGTVVDLTGATVNMVVIQDSGTAKTFSATVSDPTNGIVQYTLASGDLDEFGRVAIQLQITLSGVVACSSFHKDRVLKQAA